MRNARTPASPPSSPPPPDPTDAMDFLHMSDEDVRLLKQKYADVFRSVKQKLEHIETVRRPRGWKEDGSGPKTSKTAGRVIGRIVANTAISLITGVGAEYLDNNVTSRMGPIRGSYTHCDTPTLSYIIAKDLLQGVTLLISRLDSDVLNQARADMDAMKHSFPYWRKALQSNPVSFESALYPILIRCEILTDSQGNAMRTLSQRGYYIGMNVNFPKAILDISDHYLQFLDSRAAGSFAHADSPAVTESKAANAAPAAAPPKTSTVSAESIGESLLDKAQRQGIPAVRLHGRKTKSAQKRMATAKVGEVCTVTLCALDGMDPVWKVRGADGLLGYLRKEEYREGQNVVIARIKEKPGKEYSRTCMVYLL